MFGLPAHEIRLYGRHEQLSVMPWPIIETRDNMAFEAPHVVLLNTTSGGSVNSGLHHGSLNLIPLLVLCSAVCAASHLFGASFGGSSTTTSQLSPASRAARRKVDTSSFTNTHLWHTQQTNTGSRSTIRVNPAQLLRHHLTAVSPKPL